MCSPRNGPRSAGRSRVVSPSESRSGVRIERTRPSEGWSCSTTDPRASAWGSASASSTELMREAGTPAPTSAPTHSSTVLERNASVELRQERVAMLVAPRHRREPLVVQQVGAPDHLAEPLPEDLLRGADDEPAVGGLEVLERDDRRMRRVATTRRHEAVGRRPRADVHQLVQGRLEQRDVAVAPHAVAPGAPDPRQQGDRGGIAAGEVDEREPALRRWPAGLPGEALPAREPLHHVVVASLAGTRAGHPEARERAADDARVDVAQLLVGQPELVRLVAAEVRVHAVAGAHEIVQHLLAPRGGEGRARCSSSRG